MRFLELLLPAYGRFTDARVDLSGGDRGLHLVYGDNEAGKTTALAALRQLLTGLGHVNPMGFVHGGAGLRVGATLRLADGSELSFLRRKGRKNTVLDLDGAPLDDPRLTALLGGVTEHLLHTAFFLGRSDLRRGGEELLEDKGDVGESLFAAGLGVAGLREVLRDLSAEAAELYKPRGQNPKLNRALSRYREGRREVKALSLSAHRWDEQRRALGRAERERDRVAGELRGLRAEQARLERLQRARPRVARLGDLRRRLEELGEVPALRPDFAEQRREAADELRRARVAGEEAAEAIARLEPEVAELQVSEELLAHKGSIDHLHKRLGSQQSALADRGRLEGMRRELSRAARGILADLGLEPDLDGAVGHVPTAVQRSRVSALSDRRQATEEALARSRAALEEREAALAEVGGQQAGLSPARDVAALRRLLRRAGRRGDLEGGIRELSARVTGLGEAAAARLQALGRWGRSLADLEAAAVPGRATVERFDEELSDRRGEREQAARRLDEARDALAEAERRLDSFRRAGAVPSEEDLDEARRERDDAWHRVRAAWLEGAGEPDPALADAHEALVAAADDVADRLRREAVRVEQHVHLQAERDEAAGRIEAAGGELARAEAALEAWGEGWVAAWQPAGVEPLPPREMRGWLDRRDKLVTLAEELRELSGKREVLAGQVDGLCTELAAALAELAEPVAAEGEGLEALADRGQDVADAVEAEVRRRAELERRQQELERELAAAREEAGAREEELEAWRAGWAKAMAPLGLQADASPADARTVLERFHELTGKLDDIDDFDSRLAGMDRDAREFAGQVAGQAERCAPDLADRAPEVAAEELKARLDAALGDAERRDELSKQLTERRKAAEAAAGTARQMEARLSALCEEAGVESPEELPAVEDRWREVQALRRDVEALERTLVEDGAGAGLADVVAAAEAVEADELAGRLEELAPEIEAREARRSELDQEVGQARAELARMDGGGQAARAAEELAATAAEVARRSGRYLRLRLAEAVLRREVERYRRQHQGPLLARAGELLAGLTLGSFSGLETDVDEGDVPVLRAVRPDGERLGVEAMSEGSLDQLYLALRLASLERWLEANDPLPLVADDVLVHFDDARAGAALGALADLAAHTQVVLFTHHARLVELAEGLGRADEVFVSRL